MPHRQRKLLLCPYGRVDWANGGQLRNYIRIFLAVAPALDFIFTAISNSQRKLEQIRLYTYHDNNYLI